jgi:glycosyltransferase involved in cell wall biosynthesis
MPAVRRIVSRDNVDCLITTSPPESVHLVGLLLGRARPAWIADFRDGWTFEPWRERFPTRVQLSLDRLFERRVVKGSEVVVGATKPIAHDLQRRLAASAAWVSNGWDPKFADAASQTPTSIARIDGMVDVVYTGTMSVRGSPESLLRALDAVRSSSDPARVRLVHAGRLTTEERALIERIGVGDMFHYVGYLTRAEALALQRSADALILITSRSTSESTSKLFEYIAAGRPIVALAEGNEAARIVRETGTGITVAPNDVSGIADALRRVASGELQARYAPHDLEQYVYPAPALAMAELIQAAITRKQRSTAP